MRVEIRFDRSSDPIVFEDAITYQKGDLFCVRENIVTYKYPIIRIFDIKEYDYEA